MTRVRPHVQVDECVFGGPYSNHCTCMHCNVSVCARCCAYEGSLTTECPDEPVAFDRQQEVYTTNLDYTVALGWHQSGSLMGERNVLFMPATAVKAKSSDTVDWQQKCAELEEALAMATGPTCDGCGEPVDLEWCHCGEAVAAHGQHSGHSPVEMGCCCHVDDPARHRKAAGVLRSELFRARSEIAALKTEIAKLVANGAPLRSLLDEHDRIIRRGAP